MKFKSKSFKRLWFAIVVLILSVIIAAAFGFVESKWFVWPAGMYFIGILIYAFLRGNKKGR